MKRTGTVTVPYTFCLFCGLVALVLTMAGTVAWQVRRDTKAAEPATASRVLHGAIAPAIQEMKRLFELPVENVATLRQWAANGVFPERHPTRWPEVVIPALASGEQIQSLVVVKENGARFQATRVGREWIGSTFEPAEPDAAPRNGRWDPAGLHLGISDDDVMSGDPRENGWYTRALAVSEGGGEVSLVSEVRGKTLTLAAPLRFPGGQRGCVAVVIDGSPLWQLASRTGGIDLIVDPDAARLGQLQNEQTMALLATQALPGASNGALGQIYPAPDAPSEYWYAAESCAIGDAGAWWVIGRVRQADLPLPALPVLRYLAWALGTGLVSAIIVALVFGHRMTRPLRQVAARARGIHVLDEHYLPWPRSRFTEVNILTSALEEIYETAVEHLDYHEAPLIVWAEPEQSATDGMIEAEAVRHVFQFPRGNGKAVAEADESPGAVIEVAAGVGEMALPQAVPAAQLQVLQGTRKEVRRLQSQLAGACEELRTADNHYQQDQARMKRQRNFLRGLERLLLSEGCASVTMLSQVREVLGATRVTLWAAGRHEGEFHLSGVQGVHGDTSSPFVASFTFLALLQGEGLVTVQEPLSDPRLSSLSSHPALMGMEDPKLLAPIKFAGKLLGFFLVERATGLGRWKGDEELFTMGVANACAGVLWHQLRMPHTASPAPGATAPPVSMLAQGRNGNGKTNGNGARTKSLSAHSRVRTEDGAVYWEIDRAGCIKSIEGDVESLYGRTRDQLIGQPITFLSDSLQGQRDMDRLAGLLAGQRCKGYETSHIAVDGSAVHLSIRAKVWRDASDRIVGARGTLARVRAAIAS